ncbi:hypothetical protein GCM10022234_25820 [Aeromicrobium panaciterrae]
MSGTSIRMLIAALVALVAGPAITQSAAPAANTVQFTGHVYDKAGRPLSDIQVTLHRVGNEMDLGQTHTDSAGRFTFPAVPKSAKTLYYLALDDLSGRYVDITQTRTFTAGSSKVPDVTMTLAGFIEGKLFTKEGDEVQPAAAGTVSAMNRTTGYGGWTPVTKDGSFRIDGVRPGSYELTFTDTDLNFAGGCYDNMPAVALCEGTEQVTVKAGKVTTINTQVLDNPLEQVSGTVTDTNGAPLADVWINIWDADDSTHWLGSTYTDQDGDWTVRTIDHAGPIKVRADDEASEPSTTVWFENAASYEDATPLLLKDGGEIGGIGMVLPAR